MTPDLRCASRTGVVVLKECGSAAELTCSNCGQPACKRHGRPTDVGWQCRSCAGDDALVPYFSASSTWRDQPDLADERL